MSLAGLNLTDIAYAGGGVIANSFIRVQMAGLVSQFVPSMAGGQTGRYLTNLSSAAATWYASRLLFGRRASDVIAIALGANLLEEIATDFMPQLIPSVHGYELGAYDRPSLGAVLPGQFSSTRGMMPNPFGGAVNPYNRLQPHF